MKTFKEMNKAAAKPFFFFKPAYKFIFFKLKLKKINTLNIINQGYKLNEIHRPS